MREALLALGIAALFVGVVLLRSLVAPDALVPLSAWLLGVGFGVGLPAAVVYHALLGRGLAASGEVPARWWLDPTSHHARVPRERRKAVRAWFALGGAGFVITVAGCVALLAATMR